MKVKEFRQKNIFPSLLHSREALFWFKRFWMRTFCHKYPFKYREGDCKWSHFILGGGPKMLQMRAWDIWTASISLGQIPPLWERNWNVIYFIVIFRIWCWVANTTSLSTCYIFILIRFPIESWLQINGVLIKKIYKIIAPRKSLNWNYLIDYKYFCFVNRFGIDIFFIWIK